VTVTIGRLKAKKRYELSLGPGKKLWRWYRGGPYLGVQLHELNEDLAGYFGVKEEEGVLILSVEEDSPAEEAGLKAGDIIIKFDDETVSEPEDIHEIMSELEEDDEVTIEILRHNRKQTIKVTLGETEDVHQFFFSPGKKIQELMFKYRPERPIAPELPEFPRNKKFHEIILKKELSSSNAI